MMGAIGRGFGSLLGIKKPRVPVVPPPPGSDTNNGTEAIDPESLSAIERQRERRRLAASGGRSLLGAEERLEERQTLLGTNVAASSAELETQETRANTERDEALEAQRLERERLRIRGFTNPLRPRAGTR